MAKTSTSWEKGQSGNPKGRPVGTCPAAAYRRLLDPHIPALVQKAVDLALEGDTTALRICLERVFPALKPTDAPVEIAALNAADSLTPQGRAVIAALACGELSPDDAAQIMRSIALQARIVEVDELEERVARLESDRGH